MTLPGSGTLSFTDIETEFGLISGTNTRKLGSYRVSYSNTGDNGDLTNLPLDTGVPQSGPIKFSDFYSKKLNMIVNYYSGATETRPETAWNRYTNYNSSSNSPSDDVKVIGPALNSDGTWSVTKPTNTSGKRVIIHVNKTIGSVSDSSANKCAVRTGSGWNSGTTLQVNVGEEGQLFGAGGAVSTSVGSIKKMIENIQLSPKQIEAINNVGGGLGNKNLLDDKSPIDKENGVDVKGTDGESLENKLKTANAQGGAEAVIDSISTTASYEEAVSDDVNVQEAYNNGFLDGSNSSQENKTNQEIGKKVDLLAINMGTEADPYENLYKGS